MIGRVNPAHFVEIVIFCVCVCVSRDLHCAMPSECCTNNWSQRPYVHSLYKYEVVDVSSRRP